MRAGTCGWSSRSREAEFQKAIEADPGYPTAHHWYAINLLMPLGRFAEARAELRRALELEPLSLPILTTKGVLSYYARDYEQAIEECRRVIDLDAGFAMAHFFLGHSWEHAGQPSEAIRALERAVQLSGRSAETMAAFAHACATQGRVADARALLEQLGERAERGYVSPTLLALVRLGLGEEDEALALLEQACDVRAADLIWINERPTFDPIRSHPRFARLVERMGFPPRTAP
ncbi:MAG: tetratricopeptide repeat protein [Gemmatimonadetes bacterium]|nr:tetratricopeptide repeat protein [Gemmatimonadota bacterium]